jgi:hypothetical protein
VATGEPGDAGDVVAVLVGDDNGRQLAGLDADGGEALLYFPQGETAIQQHTRAVTFYEGRVAAAAAAQHREAHMH